jgi:hypothetical protein
MDRMSLVEASESIMLLHVPLLDPEDLADLVLLLEVSDLKVNFKDEVDEEILVEAA